MVIVENFKKSIKYTEVLASFPQLVGVSSHKSKGCGFDSLFDSALASVAGLVRVLQEATN